MIDSEREEAADGDWLPILIRWFEDSEDATQQGREESERYRDYYDGRQLTAAEVAALEKRGQPALVINRIRRKVDFHRGLVGSTRQDPKAFPRTPEDEQAASAATDALRFVCDSADFNQIDAAVWDQVLVEGAAGADVWCEHDAKGGYAIRCSVVDWDRMFYDPHSRRHDFSDARYLGFVMWMDEADLLARWPDAEDVVRAAYDTASTADTFDDRPQTWVETKRSRVRVVQMYWTIDGEWHYAAFTRGGYLDAPQPSPYVDENGRGVCSLIFTSAYTDRDNDRYGIVRDMIGVQDEINKRRSKALHLLSVRQVIAEQGAVEDVDAARGELAKPDGYLEVAPGMRFDIQQTGDLAAGQATLLQEAKAELDLMGPNAAMAGKQKGQASGVAIARQQQGGQIEASALLDQHRHWRLRVYRAMWQRVRQFWTAEMWVRVTDDERNARFTKINEPVTRRMLAEEAMQQAAQQAPQRAQMMAQQFAMMQGHPAMDDVVDVRNNMADLTVDVIIEEAPDVVTTAQEQFETIAQLVGTGRVPIPPETLIRMAPNLRDKDRIIEEMKRAMAEQAQMMAQAQGKPAAPSAPPEDPRIKATELQIEAQRAETERDKVRGDQLLGAERLKLDREKMMLTAAQAERAAQRDVMAGA